MRNLRKIGVCALSMVALVGCSISKEDAVKKTENYSQETVREKYNTCVGKQVEKVNKSEGIFATIFKVGEVETEIQGSLEVLNKAGIDEILSEFDGVTFKANGSKGLTIEYKKSGDEFLDEFGVEVPEGQKINGECWMVAKFNDDGLQEYSESSIKIDFKFTTTGLTIEGALDMITKTTFEYKMAS